MVDLPNHFFKFIPPGFKFNLSIPKSFVRKLKGWRCKKAILRRGHHQWPVHITEGGAFGDGWRKFVEENGVQEWDFIVFKHQGNMVFDFLVFDQSSCERHLYDDDSLHQHKRSKMLGKRKRTDKVSTRSKHEFRLAGDRCFLTTITPYYIRTTRLHVPMKFARSNGLVTKRRHTQVVLVDEAQRTWPATLTVKTLDIRLSGWRKLVINNGVKVGDTCMFELVKAREVPVFNFYNLKKKPINNQIQARKETTSTMHEKATSSTRYFISTLKQYNFKKTCLSLPLEFSIPNNLRNGELILRNDEGSSWNVQLNKSGKKQLFLGCGLRDFWIANGLKEGDAYKFELVENEKNKPPVVNFSLNLNSTPSGQEDRQSYSYIGKVKSYMYLPSKFARMNGLLNKEKMILKNDDERSWTVGIKSSLNFCYIGRGWKEFCAANGLKDGDLLKLEPVKVGEVPVFSFFNLGKKPTHNHIQVQNETSSTRCFISTLKQNSFKKTSLRLPVAFSKSNGLRKGEVILRDGGEGRSWKVQLNQYDENQFFLGCGLRDFWVANGLTEGDVCKFELLENEKNKPPIMNFSLLGNKPVKNHNEIKETGSTVKKATSSSLGSYKFVSHDDMIKKGKPPIINHFYLGKTPTHGHIRVQKETSSTRSFISTLKPYSFKKPCLYLPFEFSISNDLRKGEVILRDDEGRWWKLQLNKTGTNRFSLGCGLTEFLVANGLRKGDAYKFELIENEKDKPPIVNFSRNLDSTAFGIEDCPCYTGEMKAYHIEKSILYLPSEFARKNGLLNKEEMILKTADERSWTVELKCKRNKYCYVVGQGWKEFRATNGLKEGDLFKLVLVSNGDIPVAYFYRKLASS